MPKKKFFLRYFMILAVFITAVLVYGGSLLNLQFARSDEFKLKTLATTYTRKFVVPAVRGEIFDRNGVPLVTNENIYEIVIDGTKMPRKEYIGIIIDLVNKIYLYGGETEPDSLPVITIERGGKIIYSYSMDLATSSQARYNLDKFLTDNRLNKNISAGELVAFLTAKYKLDEYMPPEERSREMFRKILGICYDFDNSNILAGDYEYTISSDINKENNDLMIAIMENSHNYPGVEVRLAYKREYHFPESAPHIVGRIGKIPYGSEDWYKEMGYSPNDIVGIDGAEQAFEEYLRGINGLLERTYDQDGNLISERYLKEPVAGKNVFLTIDIKLQQVAENSIVKTIGKIHDLAKQPKNNGNGADAYAGAAAVTDPNTGQVLALATYPSYNITTYSENVAELNSDAINAPLTNRATKGLYSPGSVFKISTSLAALCSGTITPYTTIYDGVKYTKFEGYQPSCWRSVSHGSINVSEALKVSCNYFYFETGWRMGIETLADYSRQLGFGERTGIEIEEKAGILASPESKDDLGEAWVAGDILQAAIGQSINLVTPLQMANMLATVVNGGDRYKCSLLLCVKEYGSDEIYYAPDPVILNSLEISEDNLNAVLKGMKDSVDTGTSVSLFNRIPMIVGGKTGTVQVSDARSNNATFVAFAPYNEPQISVSVVIEKGAHGSWAGFAAEDIVEYYFDYTTFEQSMGITAESGTDAP